jgi:hypothetical protein
MFNYGGEPCTTTEKGDPWIDRRLKPEEEYKAEMEYCKKNGIPVRIVRVRDEITRSG